jgi:hypothetical protein
VVKDRSVYAEVTQLTSRDSSRPEWKVFVCYDTEHYLVLIHDKTVTVYVERELPDSTGVTMNWPTHMTGIRGGAIECVRRVRYREIG